MSAFQILEDAENCHVAQHKKKKIHDVPKDLVAEKKFVTENRGVLQPLNNGVRHEAKRVKLTEDKKTVEVICIDDTLKENDKKAVIRVDEEVLKIDKPEEQQPAKNEKPYDSFSKGLLYAQEYRMDIWKYLHDLERSHSFPKSKYMLKQTDLSWSTRSILVDWLVSVAAEYDLSNETFHLSVNYIDRFLGHIAVVRNKLQLVGAAAMLLAGKIEEIYPIDVKEWSYLTGDAFTPRQIIKMEQLVAKVLKFKMQPPTTCMFIEHFCQEHNLDSKTTNLAMYISELVLVEGKEYLNYLPSKLAAASIALARYTLSKEKPWPKKFKEHSGYTIQQLSPVVQKQQKTFQDSPLKEQKAVQSKYKSDKYNKVALLKPRNLVLKEFQDDE